MNEFTVFLDKLFDVCPVCESPNCDDPRCEEEMDKLFEMECYHLDLNPNYYHM